MNGALDLERRINAAQSILATPAARDAARLVWALAETCRAVAEAAAERNPRLDAGVHVSAAGMAIFAGAGSPFTQGMAMGLRGSVRADELDAIEAHLAPPGAGSRQIEVCAFADPSLHELLAERGYRAKEWQLAWTRSVSDASLGRLQPELTVCRVPPGQEELYCRVVLAGALELEDVPRAHDLGLSLSFSSTMPGTASCRNMARHGFAVAYPKIVMVTGTRR